MNKIPYFECDNPTLNRAYRLATGCVVANTVSIQTGLLKTPSPCVMAGMDYATPWTRDAAINIMNAVALLDEKVSRNMLVSVLTEENGKTLVGDQYWDSVIWGLAAYKLYEIYQDKDFLAYCYEILKNTVEKMEREEYDADLNLFRGPAVYGDGVSAYPDKYIKNIRSGAIWTWQDVNPTEKYPIGYGLPMMALSTNCLYVQVYDTLFKMATALGENGGEYSLRSTTIKDAVNRFFWNERKNTYDYLYQECDYQEGLGLAFAILFGIADETKTKKIFENTYVTDFGIPCVYPTFARYREYGVGRHSGTVWPHIQGFWAQAAFKNGEYAKFEKELFALAKNAVRDGQFVEIYHPETGEDYGGIQETSFEKAPSLYKKSCSYQTWSATAFLNMILEGVIGVNIGENITFKPYLPKGITSAKMLNLWIRGKCYDIQIHRDEMKAGKIVQTEKNGKYFVQLFC